MSRIQLFQSDSTNVVAGGPRNYTYTAGALSMFGLEGRQFFINKCATWFRENWPYDQKTGKFSYPNNDEEEFLAVQDFLNAKGLVVLMADKTRALTVDRILDLAADDPDFFDKCYDAAVLMNASLDPVRHNVVEAQQNETKTAEGKSKTQEEVNPLASSTRSNTHKD